jgi:hypothetical protein
MLQNKWSQVYGRDWNRLLKHGFLALYIKHIYWRKLLLYILDMLTMYPSLCTFEKLLNFDFAMNFLLHTGGGRRGTPRCCWAEYPTPYQKLIFCVFPDRSSFKEHSHEKKIVRLLLLTIPAVMVQIKVRRSNFLKLHIERLQFLKYQFFL